LALHHAHPCQDGRKLDDPPYQSNYHCIYFLIPNWKAKKNNEFLQAHTGHHAHHPCYSCSLLVSSLTDQVKLYLPPSTLYCSWLFLCRPPYNSTNSQANKETSASYLVPHREYLNKRLWPRRCGLASVVLVSYLRLIVACAIRVHLYVEVRLLSQTCPIGPDVARPRAS